MNIEERLVKLIEKEGKDPLTDQKLSDQLGITREAVNEIRRKKNIPAFGKRLMEKLIAEIVPILRKTPDISVRNLQSKLQQMGYNMSTSIVYKALKEVKTKEEIDTFKAITVEKSAEEKNDDDIFSKLIGYNGSIKNQIVQAKAAVLYPPKGLDTILWGQSGVGKSYIAKCMYEYAVSKGTMKKNKFVVFNCADYANNIQLLCSHLFGHTKGAFTGAEKDKKGLIELADGGMLFLDEVHRLPPEGQEMLFNVIDNGVYRRLGETEIVNHVNVMIVTATTEDINSNLLATFRRRIPMMIELPALKDRSLEERFEFIKLFMGREAKRIKRDIEISYEAACALLSFNPPNNMGQLESEIKVITANAYLKFVSQEKTKVRITLDMLPIYIRKMWMESDMNMIEERKIVPHGLVIRYDIYDEEPEEENIDIYKYIDDKKRELQKSQLPQPEVQNRLVNSVEIKINELFRKNKFDWERNTKYYNIADRHLLDIIEKFLNQIQTDHPEIPAVSSNLKYSIGFHIQTMMNRLEDGLEIIYPNLAKVKEENKEIYDLAAKLVKMLNEGLSINIPEDEIGYISMYLNSAFKYNMPHNARIGIIIACHGKVASSMLDVARHFIKDINTTAIDMDLNIKPEKIIKMIVSTAQEIDEGQGILLLTDMGSLAKSGPRISEETGIEIESIERVDTVMLMEAMYWSQFKGKSLKEIKNKIISQISQKGNELPKPIKEPECILIYCLTGIGSAKMIGQWLKENFFEIETQYQIIYADVMKQNIEDKIYNLKEHINIRAVIGNIGKVNISGIHFFSGEEIYTENGMKSFKQLLGLTSKVNLKRIFSQRILFQNPKETGKEQIINKLAFTLEEKGAVNENFINDIKDREKWVSTYIGSGIAIPHTVRFGNINYSQAAIAVYDQPIDWDGYQVSLICMFAIKEDGDKYFNLLYEKFTRNMENIKKAKRPDIIFEILFES